MSVAATVGSRGLLQLGVSLGDIAMIYRQGLRMGNWFMTKRNDDGLFETLMEPPDVLMKRKGVVEPARMESLFPHSQFIYHSEQISTAGKNIKEQHGGLHPFSWLMVAVVAALDICLPPPKVVDVLIETFVNVLDNPETESALRVSLDVNIESWRSVGQVRKPAICAAAAYQRAWKEKSGVDAIPQLNPPEEQEMIRFLECLLGDSSSEFTCFSAATFAAASAIQKCGIHIVANDKRVFETQLLVTYASEGSRMNPMGQGAHGDDVPNDPFRAHRGAETRAQMVSYPAGDPMSMVQTIRASRQIINRMQEMWMLGSRAAEKISLVSVAEFPYSPEKEAYYELGEDSDPQIEGFDPYNAVVAAKAFPRASQGIISAIETLVEGQTPRMKEWLETHVGFDYLLKNESELPSHAQENMSLWLPYQALVLGYYYKLLAPLVSLECVTDKKPYYSGLLGYGSTTFLAMCSQFGQELRRNLKVGRTHVLHMLATMYTGRNKMYYPGHSQTNLVAVMGTVSILTRPLLRTSDKPEELAKFLLVDLPVVHIAPNEEGEVYAASGSGISFNTSEVNLGIVNPHGPRKPWSIHSAMGNTFRASGPGIVMAARCEGRLVGWFSPAAADAVFLSEAYCRERHAGEQGYVDETSVPGFEITDEHWQQGAVPRVLAADPEISTGVVHSSGCPALRYAAAGFYGGIREEVAVATDDIDVALGRVQMADGGVIIA